jgi:hypothetical protein
MTIGCAYCTNVHLCIHKPSWSHDIQLSSPPSHLMPSIIPLPRKAHIPPFCGDMYEVDICHYFYLLIFQYTVHIDICIRHPTSFTSLRNALGFT